jgi:hypothetical protein
MSGIIFLGVTALWITAVTLITYFLTRRLSKRWTTYVIRILLLIMLLPLPVIDEIIAGQKFRALCREKAVVTVETKETREKQVRLGSAEDTPVGLLGVQIRQSRRNFIDAQTEAPVYHYYSFTAGGGWLIRALGISETNRPLTFKRSCRPDKLESISNELGVTDADLPKTRK